MLTLVDAKIAIGILVTMQFITFGIGIWQERKWRKDVASRLLGLKIKQGTIHNVSDAKLFHMNTIWVVFTENGKSNVRILSMDEALDLLKTRDLTKIAQVNNA